MCNADEPADEDNEPEEGTWFGLDGTELLKKLVEETPDPDEQPDPPQAA